MDVDPNYPIQALIPIEYQNEISCYYIFLEGELSENMPALDCIICTKNGNILEFEKHLVVNSCVMAGKNAEKILPIHVYYEDYDDIYYVTQLPEKQLEIISRTPDFKSYRLEKDVVQWEIDDILELGYPQLRIKRTNGIWHTFNLVEEQYQVHSLSKGVKEFSLPLEMKLKQVSQELAYALELLDFKRQLKIEVTQEILDSFSCSEATLFILTCKYVIHQGKAIIVVTLRHSGRSSVSDIQLIVTANDLLRLEQMGCPDILQDNMEACIVGVLTAEDFFPASMSACLSYKVGDKEQIIALPHHNIMPQDILASERISLESLGPREFYKVLEYCSGEYEHWQLKCTESCRSDSWQLLDKKLTETMNSVIKQTPDTKVLRYSGTFLELYGSYLMLQPQNNSIKISCRDRSQLKVMHVTLLNMMPQGCELVPCDSEYTECNGNDPKRALVAMEHELEWLCQHKNLLSKPVPREDYRNFYNELIRRSIITNSFFPTLET